MPSIRKDRGDRWTIDGAGAFVPFPGRAPEQAVVDGSGHGIGADGDDVLVRDPGAPAFQVLAQAQSMPVNNHGLPARLAVSRLPRADSPFVSMRGKASVLEGDALRRWPEEARMNAAGVIGNRNAFDLPGFGATLVQGGNLTLAVRFDDGSWTLVGKRDNPRADDQGPRGRRRGEAPVATRDDAEVAFAFGRFPGFGATLAFTADGLFSVDRSGRFSRPLGGIGLRLTRWRPSGASSPSAGTS